MTLINTGGSKQSSTVLPTQKKKDVHLTDSLQSSYTSLASSRFKKHAPVSELVYTPPVASPQAYAEKYYQMHDALFADITYNNGRAVQTISSPSIFKPEMKKEKVSIEADSLSPAPQKKNRQSIFGYIFRYTGGEKIVQLIKNRILRDTIGIKGIGANELDGFLQGISDVYLEKKEKSISIDHMELPLSGKLYHLKNAKIIIHEVDLQNIEHSSKKTLKLRISLNSDVQLTSKDGDDATGQLDINDTTVDIEFNNGMIAEKLVQSGKLSTMIGSTVKSLISNRFFGKNNESSVDEVESLSNLWLPTNIVMRNLEANLHLQDVSPGSEEKPEGHQLSCVFGVDELHYDLGKNKGEQEAQNQFSEMYCKNLHCKVLGHGCDEYLPFLPASTSDMEFEMCCPDVFAKFHKTKTHATIPVAYIDSEKNFKFKNGKIEGIEAGFFEIKNKNVYTARIKNVSADEVVLYDAGLPEYSVIGKDVELEDLQYTTCIDKEIVGESPYLAPVENQMKALPTLSAKKIKSKLEGVVDTDLIGENFAMTMDGKTNSIFCSEVNCSPLKEQTSGDKIGLSGKIKDLSLETKPSKERPNAPYSQIDFSLGKSQIDMDGWMLAKDISFDSSQFTLNSTDVSTSIEGQAHQFDVQKYTDLASKTETQFSIPKLDFKMDILTQTLPPLSKGNSSSQPVDKQMYYTVLNADTMSGTTDYVSGVSKKQDADKTSDLRVAFDIKKPRITKVSESIIQMNGDFVTTSESDLSADSMDVKKVNSESTSESDRLQTTTYLNKIADKIPLLKDAIPDIQMFLQQEAPFSYPVNMTGVQAKVISSLDDLVVYGKIKQATLEDTQQQCAIDDIGFSLKEGYAEEVDREASIRMRDIQYQFCDDEMEYVQGVKTHLQDVKVNAEQKGRMQKVSSQIAGIHSSLETLAQEEAVANFDAQALAFTLKMDDVDTTVQAKADHLILHNSHLSEVHAVIKDPVLDIKKSSKNMMIDSSCDGDQSTFSCNNPLLLSQIMKEIDSKYGVDIPVDLQVNTSNKKKNNKIEKVIVAKCSTNIGRLCGFLAKAQTSKRLKTALNVISFLCNKMSCSIDVEDLPIQEDSKVTVSDLAKNMKVKIFFTGALSWMLLPVSFFSSTIMKQMIRYSFFSKIRNEEGFVNFTDFFKKYNIYFNDHMTKKTKKA